MAEVLVLSPSFGQWSTKPGQLLEQAGITTRRPVAKSPLSSAELQAEVGNADALIVALDDVDAAVIAAAPNLKVIAKHGVGVDNIDVAAATQAGVVVVNAPGTNSSAVADLVMGLLLAVQRHIIDAHLSLLAGRWDRFHGPELAGKTIGICGFGRIGREVAARAAGFSMDVVAYDPYLDADAFASAGVRQASSVEALVVEADVLTLHLPGGGDRPLLDEGMLARLKPGAVLINAARGDLVDEHAIAKALESGALGGYGADAFSTEPPTGSPLLTAPNVVLTPHIGAFTDRANELMGTCVVSDIIAVLDGQVPRHQVTA
jgi:D-3-phosphoglycerate dehydrogenase